MTHEVQQNNSCSEAEQAPMYRPTNLFLELCESFIYIEDMIETMIVYFTTLNFNPGLGKKWTNPTVSLNYPSKWFIFNTTMG